MFDFRRALVRDTTVLADVVATNVSGTLAFDDEAAARTALHALRSEEHVVAAALYQENGAVFVDFRRNGTNDPLPRGPEVDRAEFRDGRLTIVRPVLQNDRRLGTIHLQVDLGGITDRLVVFSAIVLLILALSLLVAAALTTWLQRPITRPILQLAETARNISERKDFTVRAAAGAGGEIGIGFSESWWRREKRRMDLRAPTASFSSS